MFSILDDVLRGALAVFKFGLPNFVPVAIIVVMSWLVITALVRGSIAVMPGVYVRRDGSPVLYWFLTLFAAVWTFVLGAVIVAFILR